MEALIGVKNDTLPSSIYAFIQQEEIAVQCHLSPANSHFTDVNVLGMNFLSKLKLSIIMDWDYMQFTLNKRRSLIYKGITLWLMIALILY